MAGTARRGVEGVHTLAARAYHVCHEAGAVTADVLEDTAMGVDVWECLLHTLPLRPLKRSGVGQSRQGSVPPVSPYPQPTRHTPPTSPPPSKSFSSRVSWNPGVCPPAQPPGASETSLPRQPPRISMSWECPSKPPHPPQLLYYYQCLTTAVTSAKGKGTHWKASLLWVGVVLVADALRGLSKPSV